MKPPDWIRSLILPALYVVSGFRLRVELPPSLKLRRTAVALAEAVSRTGKVRLKAATTH